jgi:hypothetical protein
LLLISKHFEKRKELGLTEVEYVVIEKVKVQVHLLKGQDAGLQRVFSFFNELDHQFLRELRCETQVDCPILALSLVIDDHLAPDDFSRRFYKVSNQQVDRFLRWRDQVDRIGRRVLFSLLLQPFNMVDAGPIHIE